MNDLLASPLARWGAVVLVLAVAGPYLWRRLFPPRVLRLALRVRCPLCGWTGTVGKHNRKCSRCGSTTLDEIKS